MNTKVIVGVIMGFIAGFLVGGLSVQEVLYHGDGRGWMMMRGFMQDDEQTGKISGRNIDQHFIEQMIPHHQGAIDMAQVALERTRRPEIKSLAEGIIQAQTLENTNMKNWYKEWFGADVPETFHGMMMHIGGMEGDIDTLKNAKDVDLEFIRQMIPHHEMAIMMATMLKNTTQRQEMKELADQIITSQAREIQMMQSWAKAWSGQ